MQNQLKKIPVLVLIGIGLVLYSVFLVIITGQRGFHPDDYGTLTQAFWHPIPEAYRIGSAISRRPTQTVYSVTMLKLFSYDMRWIHLGSLGLHITSCLLMGGALRVAFPKRDILIVGAVIFAFFAPPASVMTYFINADNTRLAPLFFWLTVLLYQYWARNPRIGVIPLLPVFTFSAAILAYESVILFFLIIPLFMLPIYWQRYKENSWRFHAVIGVQYLASNAISLATFYYIRSVYNISSPFAPPQTNPLILTLQYITNLLQMVPFVLTQTIKFINPVSVIVGVVFALGMVRLLNRQSPSEKSSGSYRWYYVLMIGIGLFALGIIPFIMVGLQPANGLTAEGRMYSSALFGFAIIGGFGLDLLNQTRWRVFAISIAAVIVGILATFHVGLYRPWHGAYIEQQTLYQNLYKTIPDVKSPATLLIADFAYVTEDGIPLFSNELTNTFINLFYQDFRINAAPLLSTETDIASGFEPIIEADGLSTPGNFVPNDRVILLRRVGLAFEFITDDITPASPYYLIWESDDVALRNNPDLIISNSERDNRFHRIIHLEQ